MAHASLAAQVLDAVLKDEKPPRALNGFVRVLDSWTEGERTICVVYEGWW